MFIKKVINMTKVLEEDESFEKLSKGLDEERRRQGGRTLFS
jgi:hypothetical protein